MNFCERWRARFSEAAPLCDGHEVFGIESDDVSLAIPAMHSLIVQRSTHSGIVLPLDWYGDSDLISGSGSCSPANLCELPLSLGGVDYTLSPALMSTTQSSSVLGAIQDVFPYPERDSLSPDLPIDDMYWGEAPEVPSPLSKLTFGRTIVTSYLGFASYSLGVTTMELGLANFANDVSNVYPTLQQLWEDSISAIAD